MFIVIVGVGVTGLVSVMNSMVKTSADPMLRKQALAIAESLLEEIMLQPFTTCDPDAYDAATDTCTKIEAIGPETSSGVTETRNSVSNPFDNVNDYNGVTMTAGIESLSDGSVIPGLDKYQAAVSVAEAGTTFSLPSAEVLKISITVTDPAGEQLKLSGYRFRYAPTP